MLTYEKTAPTDEEIQKLIRDGLRAYSRRGYVEYADTARALKGAEAALEIAGDQENPVDMARLAVAILDGLTEAGKHF